MFDFGPEFNIDMTKCKTPSSFVFKGKTYRISIISNVLIRFEYSETGSFNDFPTFFAENRSFATPKYVVEEDGTHLIIKNDYFILQYEKEKPFVGTKFLPDQNLKVTITNTEKTWYFNHPEVKNFLGTSYSLDNSKGNTDYTRGLFSLDGFTSFDDSRTPILTQKGNVIAPNYKNVDTYLFIYNNDFGLGLKDYFLLTGLPPLIPRYALGIWWNKEEQYKEIDIQKLIADFRYHQIPLSVLMLGSYAREPLNKSNISFMFNKNIFPNPLGLSEYLHKNSIKLGLNVKTEGLISTEEDHFKEFSQMYGSDPNNCVLLNVYDNKLVNAYLKTIINPLLNNGVDFLWADDFGIENNLRNYVMNYYLFKNMSTNKAKRNFLLTRNNGICPHKYQTLYSGDTRVSWKTLKLLPFFNATAANIGVSWWSHDIGGFKSGIEDSELYLRYIQFGVYSPIFRLASAPGKYYKREPWKWDAKTFEIVRNYMRRRQKLIPYIYSEAYKYSTLGSPITQPLYYRYPETYDEPLYKNEFYFGSELFVAPITDPKDLVMNRVVHRIFLPNGVWYDFKTGKKFMGGKRYVTFYKDEDYPVFAKTGAIIPMTKLNPANINDTSSPKKMEIQIFPGRSNTYKVYEDDGDTSMYKEGYTFTSEINYFYKEDDFSVSIEPLSGKKGIIPDTRDYIIKFRNTKFTDNVQVFCDEVNVQYRRYVEENDFIIEFDNMPTTSKVYVYCKGKDIEIDASRVINEDLESIVTDLKIETKLKEELDAILFSNSNTKAKKIAIRRLRRKGLTTVFIKMFMKLLECIEEV